MPWPDQRLGWLRREEADDGRCCTARGEPAAQLDGGDLRPTAWALAGVDAATEEALADVVRRAAG